MLFALAFFCKSMVILKEKDLKFTVAFDQMDCDLGLGVWSSVVEQHSTTHKLVKSTNVF